MAKPVVDPVSGKNVDRASEKNTDLSEAFMTDESDNAELNSEAEVPPSRTHQKDPTIRRKIEDLLERKRLREELGIYDEDVWEGL